MSRINESNRFLLTKGKYETREEFVANVARLSLSGTKLKVIANLVGTTYSTVAASVKKADVQQAISKLKRKQRREL
jgi:hypothetical protein